MRPLRRRTEVVPREILVLCKILAEDVFYFGPPWKNSYIFTAWSWRAAQGGEHETTDAGQRSRCPRALRGGMRLCLQLSRHPQHGDHRGRRQVPRDLRGVGPQREGGHGSGLRRLPGGKAELLRHEARGAQRGGGPPVYHRLHRRQRRDDHRRGRRRGDALVPERAGLPPLRHGRQAPHAGAQRLRRGPGVHQAGL